jgi:ankyrin repeat protein
MKSVFANLSGLFMFVALVSSGEASANQALVDAVISQNVTAVENVLKNDPSVDVNYVSRAYSFTALCFAAEKDSAEIVQLLLAQPKVNANQECMGDFTPVMLAMSEKKWKNASVLIASPLVAINREIWGSAYGRETSAFAYAASLNQVQLMKEILSRKDFDPKLASKAFYDAINALALDSVRFLIDFPSIDVNHFNLEYVSYSSALEVAMIPQGREEHTLGSEQHLELLKTIIASPRFKPARSSAALEAIGLNDLWTDLNKTLRLLIESKIDLSFQDEEGQTALSLAKDKGLAETATLLEKAGVPMPDLTEKDPAKNFINFSMDYRNGAQMYAANFFSNRLVGKLEVNSNFAPVHVATQRQEGISSVSSLSLDIGFKKSGGLEVTEAVVGASTGRYGEYRTFTKNMKFKRGKLVSADVYWVWLNPSGHGPRVNGVGHFILGATAKALNAKPWVESTWKEFRDDTLKTLQRELNLTPAEFEQLQKQNYWSSNKAVPKP